MYTVKHDPFARNSFVIFDEKQKKIILKSKDNKARTESKISLSVNTFESGIFPRINHKYHIWGMQS